MKKIVGILLSTAFICASKGLTEIKFSENMVNEAKSVTKIENIKRTAARECSVVQTSQDGLHIRAKSAYLMDFGTESVMYAQNETERLPIASMCKIMTLLLSFDAIQAGNLDINEEVVVSERAASMGGSQVFLEVNGRYSVKELLKSIVVCSANDSCVALAEKIAGGEGVFVDRMNEKAKEIGATNTLFANCTGLPKEPQYSCAKDVAIMLKKLLQHEQYYEFGKVWMDKFMHPKGRFTEITNTNKLVRFYDGCDGGKTGYTSEAGFCLAATAKRKDMRVISVVIGEESSANRFQDVRSMFDYAFANYAVSTIIEEKKPLELEVNVNGGKEKKVKVYPERSAYVFSRKGEKANYTVEAEIQKVKAPLKKDAKVGELIVFSEGVEKERIPLLSMQEVKKANWFDRFKEVARNWNA